MKQIDKEILLKDLCARLYYGVKALIKYPININECKEEVRQITSVHCGLDIIQAENIDVLVDLPPYDIKPYLFPLSSMTKEQKEEWKSLMIKDSFGILYYTLQSYDYLYKNHIDIRGLIPMGLAIDCTNLNIY